ncbi:DUF3320 domain-containing protein [Corynebacterium xerosis]|uniref:DUF3320 domain-containing protein n=1 Tax=Corynebacterium xerosis TaxID=1725 RepID=UPI00364E53FD
MNDCEILVEDYVCGPTSIVGAQDDLDGRLTKDARARLEAAIAEVVAVEAPIELDALTRKIGKRFGYQRVARRWKKKIAYRIPGGVLIDEGPRSFIWPEGSSPATWRGYRASEGARTIAEIPTTELANAIVAAVGNAPEGLDHEGAYRGAMALFGLSRLTSLAAEYLEEALALAIIRGDLVDEGTRVTLAPATAPLAENETVTDTAAGTTPEATTPHKPDATIAQQAASIDAGGGIKFKRFAVKPGMSIVPLIQNHRRGIYVLEFADGCRYVGLSVNVVSRFTTHVHGSSHHEGWKDIVALRFREMPEGNLREAEIDEILRQQSLGYELRNKDLNFGHRQKTKLDGEVSVEDQKHWALGDGKYDIPDLDDRPNLEPDEQSKLAAHVPSKVPEEVYNGVLDDIAFCLSHVIPDAVNLEAKYWTISDWPRTAGGRLATLNVGALELAYFPREPITDPSGQTDDEFHVMYFNLPPEVLEDDDPGFEFTSGDVNGAIERVAYNMTDAVRIAIPVGRLRAFFTDMPELLTDARVFAIDVMRYQDSAIFRRHHSRALTNEVFDQYRA